MAIYEVCPKGYAFFRDCTFFQSCLILDKRPYGFGMPLPHMCDCYMKGERTLSTSSMRPTGRSTRSTRSKESEPNQLSNRHENRIGESRTRSTSTRSTRPSGHGARTERPDRRMVVRGREREWYRLNRPLQIAVTCFIVLCASILAFGLLYDQRQPSLIVRPDPVQVVQKTNETIHHVEIEPSTNGTSK